MTTVEFIKAIITAKHGWEIAEVFEFTYENPSPSNFSNQTSDSLDLIKETIDDLFDSNFLNDELMDELEYYLNCMAGTVDDDENDINDDGFDDYDYDKGLFDDY